MIKKFYILIAIFTLTICIVIGFSSCKNKKDLGNPPTTQSEQDVMQSEAKLFSYQIKDEYSSRAEIYEEIKKLSDSYLLFRNTDDSRKLTDEQIDQSRSTFNTINKHLADLANEKFPFNEDEKQQIIKDQFYYRIQLYKENVDNFFLNFPSASQDDASYLAYKQMYEIVLKYKEKYESGQLTIEQANDESKEEAQKVTFPPQETVTFDYKNYQTTKMP